MSLLTSLPLVWSCVIGCLCFVLMGSEMQTESEGFTIMYLGKLG